MQLYQYMIKISFFSKSFSKFSNKYFTIVSFFVYLEGDQI